MSIFKVAKKTWSSYKDFKKKKRQSNVIKQLGLDIEDRFFYPEKTQQGQQTYSVVSAVYGVEKYINDMMSSLLRQSLDFRKHIQVILVDDGSIDGSADICKEWAERFPENVIYLRKENGGQATARNFGLPHATGDWVCFIDPDDMVDKDYFLSIEKALEQEDDIENLQCISSNFIIYLEDTLQLRDSHPLNYRYRHGIRRSVFDENCDDIQLSAGHVLFQRHMLAESKVSFQDIKPTSEDLHFVACYLLAFDSPQMLFVPAAKYWYRKRADKSSTLDSSWSDPRKYKEQLENSYLDLFEKAKVSKGYIPRWLQRTVLYDIAWNFIFFLNNHRNEVNIPLESRAEYLQLLHQILKQIDSDSILNFELAGVHDPHRMAMLALGNSKYEHISNIRPLEYDQKDSSICVRYYYVGAKPDLKVIIGAEEIQPLTEKIRQHTFLDRVLVREHILWLPWHGSGMMEFYLNGERQERGVSERSKLPTINRLKPKVSNPKGFPLPVKVYRRLSQSDFYKQRFTDAWLLMDRDIQADDSAEHLYRYIKEKHSQVNTWFVLRKNSHDWQRLEAEGFRLLAFGSLAHKMALLNAKHLISSHADHYITNYLPHRYYRDLLNYKFTFLQHGVIQNDLSGWLNSKSIRNFITAGHAEYRSLWQGESGYKFTEREIQLTGLPRHDALLSKSISVPVQKKILIMPTWRNSLAGETLGAGHDRKKNANFKESQFYQAWLGLLKSPRLSELANKHGYQLIFFPHANLQPYLDDFRNEYVTVLGHADIKSMQELFVSASMLITDYSSVAFEVAYLQRPVLYYQFDQELVFGGGHTAKKGYFDYTDDGFGPVAIDDESLLDSLEQLLINNCQPDAPYAQRMQEFFAFRDGRCCERVYDMIANT